MVARGEPGQDGGVAEPVTVWMVHLRRGHPPTDVEGTLSIDGAWVVFESEEAETPTRLGFHELTSAKRVRGSPILFLRWRRDDERRETAFYFAPPPPLGPLDARSGTSVTPPPTVTSTFRRPTKRRQRRDNTTYLATLGGDLKPLIEAWVADVRAGMESARGEGG